MAHRLEIRLFGGVQVALDGVPLNQFMSVKVPALLAYLAVTGRPHQRAALAGLLWGEMPDAAAANNLRQALTSLRKSLEPFLIVTRETVGLNPACPFTLDVAAFAELVASVRGLTPGDRIRRLEAAVDLYQGDFLAGFYVRDAPEFEEWMLAQRARYRELTLHTLHMLTQHHLDAGQYDQVISETARLLSLAPWREEAHQHLMLALARTGQRSAALAQYQRCRRLLGEELGVEPSVETTALYERIRASLRGPRHNLPAATTGFTGREVEVAELHRLVTSSEARLVTMLGMGGAGKTRLALEVARVCEPTFLNGAWFVPLVPPAELAASQPGGPDALALVVAEALGHPLAGPTDPKAQMLAFLRGRELLLVIDNLEGWTDAIPWLCELLAAAPGVTILATSRERLNVRAERMFVLAGLPVPPPGSSTPQAFAAAQLFVLRAQHVQTGFTLTAEDSAAVARICRAVQGLPLGIELAAARADQLSYAEIAAEIELGMDLMATTHHDVPLRQRSLRAVFDWSWGRLSSDEQTIFRRLAIYSGPFSRAAAVHVTGASLPSLAALGDKSLVSCQGTNYQLHEVARRFARERLDQAGEAETIRARHAAYYAEVLAQHEEHLRGRDQKAALEAIESEIENVRAAWQWMVEGRDVAGLAAAAGGLYHCYLLRSRFRWGLDAFHAARLALKQIAQTDRSARLTYSRVMAREARFCSSLSQYTQAQELLSASLPELRALGAAAEVAFVLGHMGGIARLQGDLDIAESHLSECLALRRQTDDRWGQAITLLELAGVAFMRENFEAARLRCEEGLVAGGGSGDLQTTAHLLTGLSLSHRELGQYAQAEAYVRRSLETYEALGDQYGILQACLTLGELCRQLGDHRAAGAFCERAVSVSQEIGDRSGEADGRFRLGQIAAGLGDRTGALRQLRHALVVADEIGETLTILDILLEIACLLADEDTGRSGRILTLLINHPRLPDQRRARATSALARLAASAPVHTATSPTWAEILSLAGAEK